MSIASKIQPIERDISVILDETLSPRARSQAFADFARAEIREAQDVNRAALGSLPPHKTWVDGKQGAVLESVRPDGRIFVQFQILNDVLAEVALLLYQNSPLGDPENGHYRDRHVLFADGIEVPDPRSAPPASEYVFLNPSPYSRKIEVGQMTMRVPGSDHVYERTRQTASRRFSKIATIQFTYQAIAGSDRVPALRIIPK